MKIYRSAIKALCVAALLGTGTTQVSADPPVYDMFNGPTLDIRKWDPLFIPLYAQEWRRDVRGGNLRLFVRGVPGSTDPALIGGHEDIFNGISIISSRENLVRSIDLRLVIESADVRRCSSRDAEISEAMFLMASSWFNDGSGAPGTDATGDIRTSFAISHNSGSSNQLDIIALVFRWNGSSSVQVFRQNMGVVGFGSTLVLRTTWDPTDEEFRFSRTIHGIGSQFLNVDYTSFATAASDAGNSFHELQARSEPAYCGDEETYSEIDVYISRARVANYARGN